MKIREGTSKNRPPSTAKKTGFFTNALILCFYVPTNFTNLTNNVSNFITFID